MSKKSFEENGLMLSKKTIYDGDKIKISYNGLLAQSGASNIYLHFGFGDKWDDSSLIQMEPEDGAFTAAVEITGEESLEICFKDSADNWDNNSGQNYVFKIYKKPVRKNSKTELKGAKGKDIGAQKTIKSKKTKQGNKAVIST